MAITMNAFEAVAVITAMPTVAADLHGDSLYGAAFSAYMLASLIALIWSGESADRRGPFPPFLAGVGSFALGLVVAGLAPNMGVLVLGRILQGAGSGSLASVSYVAIGRVWPSEARPKMFAALSAAWVVPSLVAPLIAGLVTQHFGWRWVFLSLLPLLPILLALAGPSLARLPAVESLAEAPRRLGDALLLATAVGLALTGLQTRFIPVAVVLTLGGVAIAIPPLRRLLPEGTIHARRGLAATVAARFCVNVAFFGADTFLPLAASRLHGAGPLGAGAIVVGASLTWTAGSWLTAKRSEAWHPGRAVAIGSIIVGVGIISAAPIVVRTTPLWLTFVGWSLAGPGIGIVFTLTAVTALDNVPAGREGLVSSQLQMADALGFALISGIGGALVAVADHTALTLSQALVLQFSLAAAVAVVGALAGVRVRGAARV
jgi:MFS family permease